ncbi:MAG TPA: hypothetical protein VJY35_11755 [Candidatus Eisenbacteria bacterium]|nr:hypothetical protein [Candidatus Eisenbacteria bacterium]
MRRTTNVKSICLAVLISCVAVSAASPNGDSGKARSAAKAAKSSAAAKPGKTPAPTSVAGPAVFLSWSAPLGVPGARDTAFQACNDTTAAETLFVTFDPGEGVNQLMGIDARLLFTAQPGDSLEAFWDFSRSGANPWNLRIEFDEPPAGAASPWAVGGSGGVRYDRRKNQAALDLSYAVAASRTMSVLGGTRYFLARVIIRLRRAGLAGCRTPVCIELDHMVISHGGSTSRWISDGERFVSWNSPGGAACSERRAIPPRERPNGYEDLTKSDPHGSVEHAAPRDSTR